MPRDVHDVKANVGLGTSPTARLELAGPIGRTAVLDNSSATIPMQPPEEGLAAGTMVHHFEVIRELGRGGMGRVYLARDSRLARRVALKFLLSSSQMLTRRFLVEARNTARCQHEHIVVIYEADEWNGAPYMALEYLDGTSLVASIEGERLPIPRVVEILSQVTRALVRAHAHGIVHCDLKPENILVTTDGGLKVVDFGVARMLGMKDDGQASGTPPYMSPEQWGLAEVDHRSDLWSLGIIAWELITGAHPLGEVTVERAIFSAAQEDVPMPRLRDVAPHVPPALDAAIMRCLTKRKAERIATAAELLTELEMIGHADQTERRADDPPYPGMAAFEEADAARFFGRERDVARAASRLAEAPFVVLAGPSGVGKSSFVRAGLVPALKRSGESWTSVVLRPGRDPLAAVAAACAEYVTDVAAFAARLRDEPGAFGVSLRARCRDRATKMLVFVDQFEETFTLVADPALRAAFIAALAGAADDIHAPIRVVLAVRSDFLDRLGDDPALLERLSTGLVLLRPLGTANLREALEHPLAPTGFTFESPAIIDEMISQLGESAGALPLVQFAAASLWDARDPKAKLLTRAAYDAMGGIAGALASHAEDTVRSLPQRQRALLRTVLARLVTAEGTRAIVDRVELESIDEAIGPLLDRLVAARLLALTGNDGEAVELVHESLIRAWPTLRRWREEAGEDAALVAQVRSAALQWDQRGRPSGLLWSGAAVGEIRTFLARFTGELAPREAAFLDAAIEVADRTSRRRRRLVVGSFVVLVGIVAAALVAVVWVRNAERTAQLERTNALRHADQERAAKDETQHQLEAARASELARKQAQEVAANAESQERDTAQSLGVAKTEVAETQKDLETTNARLRRTLAEATAARKKAEGETARANQLATDRERLIEVERKRADEAEKKAAGLAKRLQ